MFKPPCAAAITAVLITLSGGLFGLGEAHARAIYTGTFDPENDFYKWSGTHAFSVDEACLGTDGWKAVNGNNVGYDPLDYSYAYASCGTAELNGGTLTLLDKIADAGETLDFSGQIGSPLSFGIWGIYVKNGELAGVDTDLIGSLLFETSPLDSFAWFLRWESGKAPEDAYLGRSQSAISDGLLAYSYLPSTVDPVYLSRCSFTDFACILATEESAVPTFNRVPEPGSLALAAMALVAAGFSARRARRG